MRWPGRALRIGVVRIGWVLAASGTRTTAKTKTRTVQTQGTRALRGRRPVPAAEAGAICSNVARSGSLNPTWNERPAKTQTRANRELE
eukprot:1790841-Rhodomonas_salina.4